MAKGRLNLFREFFQSEKSGGFVLIGCTVISLICSNVGGDGWVHFWHRHIDLSFGGVALDYSIEHWINDGLMTVFFLLVGLEIERELYIGELSTSRKALLPIIAAAGGMIVPALIHSLFNAGTPTASGFGIPMATDIAFALGILSLVGKRVPLSLKIFLTALAIIDDLGAIAVIALFYSKGFSWLYFGIAIGIFGLLYLLGRLKVAYTWVYVLGGILLWYAMLKSGIHATIAGVLLAFAIPFNPDDRNNLSFRLQRSLHHPVAFVILPLFALANTAIVFPGDILGSFTNRNSLGIILGLAVGKCLGIFGFSWLAVRMKIATLAGDLNWRYILGISLLGGIGFTMSIFITNLAFTDLTVITASKMSILLASLAAALSGLAVLKRLRRK